MKVCLRIQIQLVNFTVILVVDVKQESCNWPLFQRDFINIVVGLDIPFMRNTAMYLWKKHLCEHKYIFSAMQLTKAVVAKEESFSRCN